MRVDTSLPAQSLSQPWIPRKDGSSAIRQNQGIERENPPDFLSALAIRLYQKYLSTGSEPNIYAAVEYSRSAVHIMPDVHQALVGKLNSLAKVATKVLK